jgi:hypothetical protein
MFGLDDLRKLRYFILSKVSATASTGAGMSSGASMGHMSNVLAGAAAGWRGHLDSEYIALRGIKVQRASTGGGGGGYLTASGSNGATVAGAASMTRAVLAVQNGPTLDAVSWACQRLGLVASMTEMSNGASVGLSNGQGGPSAAMLVVDARGSKFQEAQDFVR